MKNAEKSSHNQVAGENANLKDGTGVDDIEQCGKKVPAPDDDDEISSNAGSDCHDINILQKTAIPEVIDNSESSSGIDEHMVVSRVWHRYHNICRKFFRALVLHPDIKWNNHGLLIYQSNTIISFESPTTFNQVLLFSR